MIFFIMHHPKESSYVSHFISCYNFHREPLSGSRWDALLLADGCPHVVEALILFFCAQPFNRSSDFDEVLVVFIHYGEFYHLV